MTFLKDAFEWIRLHSETKQVKIDDRNYSSGNWDRIVPPSPRTVELNSLNGLLDFSKFMAPDDDSLSFIVASHEEVRLSGDLNEIEMVRHSYAKARPCPRDAFIFDRYMSIEDFIVKVQSRFADGGDKAAVIKAVSGISASEVSVSEDDGLTQNVTTKNKVSRLEQTKMDPIVHLAPFRTFNEIAQPESPFLLRFQRHDKGLPSVALIEADGGAWKLDAMNAIAKYLQDKTVLAVIA